MAATWSITEHCCAACFGRVLRREPDPAGAEIVRCADCGIERSGTGLHPERLICACGIRFASGRDARIRCRRQEQISPEFPAEIVAVEVA